MKPKFDMQNITSFRSLLEKVVERDAQSMVERRRRHVPLIPKPAEPEDKQS